ncbi:ligase-associated DNA damage response endonuclease PdeM [Niveispirillum sp. BGYR6]|uniref:ligase-associated DNA damage response endonuclease PdeM n=1 Tax=Niveispirillum sp. BGYR6 TaxID=2971249 RepID=UPI0022B9D27B|nr:ligase-associated DNA damage response endonuclease PdeM [Niveispirillum sp. BGYR6]MDG5495486.1 ligase-associated DNA damage response endonuclease PdeM [Niveispirillum sp. BGYR6]
MSDARIPLNGTLLLPDLSGALFWPEQGWLLVADLHLEKGSAYARFGQLLPPYDTAATLARLEQACQRWQPRRVICLGDSFHDADAASRISGDDGRRIAALTSSHDWVWISGNHDPAPPPGWGGMVTDSIRHGPLLLRHAAEGVDPAGEISGHYHPKAVTQVRGRRLSARCFVSDGQRLILPAFGAYTGGLNVLDPAIRTLFGADILTWALGTERLHLLPAARLTADAATRQALRRVGG